MSLSVYNIVTIVSVIIMTFLILIQTRGASLGAGIGSSGDVNTERRGTDKTIYQITIVCAIVFILSLLAGVMTA